MSCARSSPRASLFTLLDRFLRSPCRVRLLPLLGEPSPSLSTGRESITPNLRAWRGVGRPELCARPPSAPGGAGRRRRALAHARSPADSGLGRCGGGVGAVGAGVEGGGLSFHPPFGTRARASVHTRSLWSPGSVRQVRDCGTNRSVGGVPSRFQRCFPGPL